jgi:uncharacterized protein (TIGR02246 family)
MSKFFSSGVVLLLLCGSLHAEAGSADETAIRAVSAAWKRAYNQGDAAAVAALYSADAVLSAPGEPAVRGAEAIARYFREKIAQFSSAGLTVADQPLGPVVASGELGWQWQTYTVSDKAGRTVDAGKLVTLFRRQGGKWLIAGDTWNSDGSAVAPAAGSPVPTP